MDDLISRQAAIDAANRADYTGLALEDVKKVTDEVVKELKQLPSVQPEQNYCKDCRKHNATDGFKTDICPLVRFRGQAQGHEFDYQYCVYFERRERT